MKNGCGALQEEAQLFAHGYDGLRAVSGFGRNSLIHGVFDGGFHQFNAHGTSGAVRPEVLISCIFLQQEAKYKSRKVGRCEAERTLSQTAQNICDVHTTVLFKTGVNDLFDLLF